MVNLLLNPLKFFYSSLFCSIEQQEAEPITSPTPSAPTGEGVAPEENEEQPIMMKEVGAAEEESTTVGAEVTSLSNTPAPATPTEAKGSETEPPRLVAIPEEALEVGAVMGETKNTVHTSCRY